MTTCTSPVGALTCTDPNRAGPHTCIDRLEPRRLLATALQSGILEITGTAGADRIVVALDGGGQIVVSEGAGTTSVALADVSLVSIVGGAGDDHIEISTEIELPSSVYGEEGADALFGGGGRDALFGGDGDDNLVGNGGVDALRGEGGDDRLHGGGASDRLFGHAGADSLFGAGGHDTLAGAEGDDFADGGIGNDSLDGGAGEDTLLGGKNDDRLRGGDDDDLLNGGPDRDTLVGDDGIDKLFGGPGSDVIDGVDFGSRPTFDERLGDELFGDDGDDLLLGDVRTDRFDGGEGDNRFFNEDDREFFFPARPIPPRGLSSPLVPLVPINLPLRAGFLISPAVTFNPLSPVNFNVLSPVSFDSGFDLPAANLPLGLQLQSLELPRQSLSVPGLSSTVDLATDGLRLEFTSDDTFGGGGLVSSSGEFRRSLGLPEVDG